MAIERSQIGADELTVTALHNGVILGHPQAEGIMLRGNRIEKIGILSELAHPSLEQSPIHVVDLKGKFVAPGFVDAHIHLLQTGLVESGWTVKLAGHTREETLDLIASVVAERAGEWVVAYGWDESTWDPQAYLTRKDLDRVSASSPVLAVRVDGHLLTANSPAMAQIPHGVPAGLVDHGRGILRESAASLMLRSVQPDRSTQGDALRAASHLCHRLGITSVHTMTRHEHWEAFERDREDRCLRVTFCPEIEALDDLRHRSVRTGDGDAWLRYGGVKIFADGSIGAQNAAVSAPYLSGGTGELNHSDEQLRSWIRSADRAGWQTVIHAIGDRAIGQALAAHASIETDPTLRHRVEHFELPTKAQIEQTKSLGLYVSMQPNFTANWSGPGRMYEERLGVDRDRRSNPLRTVHEMGIPLALGSDGMPPGPLYGASGALIGTDFGQRLTLDQVLECYTAGGARFGFSEDYVGRLEPGMLADLVVLDRDPRDDPLRVSERSVEMTWVGGRQVFARGSDHPAGAA